MRFQCGVFYFMGIVYGVATMPVDGGTVLFRAARVSCIALTQLLILEQASCTANGKTYLKSESWISNNLEYLCLENGSVTATGCITDSKIKIRPGAQSASSGILHRCVSQGNGEIAYSTQPCGLQIECRADGV